ncbi:PRC-barrel domain-containing protein [Fictibacillus aquaticus]|uniref:PRC-barrel domain-containing protein n=1 Tax=Fictibacillus aquaticus TaxID=2021314 RepID=A0A235FBV9_9BACL|nr:PRC-barrel domain-containing protein [Fictibacillus aquaticus]OYD58265.1 hypothetical protein CGZ90_10315 [Fictibacillus aquaticus]
MLKISELIGKKIEQLSLGKTEHKVNDVLFREDDNRIGYIVYHVQTIAVDQTNPRDDGYMNKASTWVAGMNTSNVPSPGMMSHQESAASNKDTYYIPWPEVDGITEDKLIYHGNERQKSENDNCVSWKSYKELTVIHPDGRELGQISDGYLNPETGKIEGWEITGGFWKQLMGDGTKTIHLEGRPDWSRGEWRLQSEPEALMQEK